MLINNPMNISLMDLNEFIKKRNILEVTSHSVYEASSNNFHPRGLFSELIFGQIASEQRMIKFGFVDLNTTVLHPLIYKNITSLKGLYEDIMDGKVYAKYDEESQDLIRADEEEGETGIGFFLRIFPKIKFKETGSDKRSTKIEIMDKFKDRLFIDKFLILPAGVRDIKISDGRATSEEINKIYLGILSLSQAMPKGFDDNPIFDGIRNNLQKKVVQLYTYIQNIIDGKGGFLQKKYGARSVALGTRNVITASDMTADSPMDPSFIKYNETQIPLFQCMKAFQPVVFHTLKSVFLDALFTPGSSNITTIDPKTLKLHYSEISEATKNLFLTSDGIETLVNRFANTYIRDSYFTISTTENKEEYLYLIHDDPITNTIHIFRDMDYFLSTNPECKKINIKPMTYAEIFYIATQQATLNKHVLITRYPVTSIESIYPSKVKLVSTEQSRKVTIVNGPARYQFPHFPTRGKRYLDSLAVHPSKLEGLGGADYDGDTVSCNSVISEEANMELNSYFNKPSSVVSPDGKLIASLSTYLCKHVVYNLSKPPKKI